MILLKIQEKQRHNPEQGKRMRLEGKGSKYFYVELVMQLGTITLTYLEASSDILISTGSV